MANTLIVKRSSVAGKVPLATDLQVGELAVNLADQKIYSKNAAGTVVQLGGGSGSGDVVGPASATDNALVRFDGTTGKLVQNSQGILDDSGNLDVASAKADYFDLDTAATPPADAVGRTSWDDGSGGSILGLKGGNVTYYTGQQEFARVYNGSGATMTKGQVVYIVGAQGNRVDVRLAKANAESTSANTIGFIAETIVNGAEGWVQTTGPLPKLNTSTLTAGQALYLSPTTAGAYTATKPTAPNHIVILGFVERVDATVGSIYLKIDNGYELDELHNVLITSPTSGDTLIYDATAGVWENGSLSAGSGIGITNGAGSITISNTAPDQTVVLTGAGATSVTGTYPNFTISSVNTTYSVATSTVAGLIELASDTQQSVSANAVSATAGRTYGLQLNAAGQAVVNVPWTDTNSGGTVTSVGGTGTVSGLTLTGTVTTSGNLTLGGTLAVTPSNFASQTANTVLAAPNGAAGTPSFRAIVAADIPTLNQNTTGTAANVTGTVAVANGGTGATSAATALTNLGAYPSSNPSGYTSNTGTVTSVATGTGLTGGPITTSGTISLANTAVSAGSYTYASITVDAQGRITAASNGAAPSAFPAGTAMLFVQTSAPTGWTKSTTHDNKALRVVSGTASSGGSVAFTTAFASQAVNGTVGATTLSSTQIPSHQHDMYAGDGSVSDYFGGSGANYGIFTRGGSTAYNNYLGFTGGGSSHTHSFSGTAINLNVQYVDTIIATKD